MIVDLTESDIKYLKECVLSSTLLGHEVKKGSKVLRKLDQALLNSTQTFNTKEE